MRHRRKGSRLGRTSHKLKALLRSLVTSLILNEKMVTTQSKAKALIPLFDRLVIKVRKNSEMNAIRELKKVIYGEAAQRKFMEVIVPQLEGRPSGFTKTIKIGFRVGDNAPAVRIEVLSNASAETEEAPEEAPKKAAKKAPAKKAPAKKVKKEESPSEEV